MTKPLLRTNLYDWHVKYGAKMVPFAGWEMPVQYSGIKTEHLHTRAHAGLFDVSHMGQLLISGASAVRELEHLLPVDLSAMAIGHAWNLTLHMKQCQSANVFLIWSFIVQL